MLKLWTFQHTTEFGECEECGYEDLAEIEEKDFDRNKRRFE